VLTQKYKTHVTEETALHAVQTVTQNSRNIVYCRNIVCFRYGTAHTAHKVDNMDIIIIIIIIIIIKFRYRDPANMEPKMCDYTSYNWSHWNINDKLKEKSRNYTRKTSDRFTTVDSYTWNITHKTESTAV
jgi:hypothetical protein